jgi:phosphatidylglycerol:prolipoprotein diacylglycerol transferase
MYPELFRIGDFYIGTFGLLVALGFLAGIQYGARAARRIPIPPERVYDLALVIMIAALVGSRLAYILVEWKWFLRDPWSLVFSRQGYVFYGGFIAALLAGIGYCRWKELPVARVADAMAPGVALGHAFGRIGCYLNGCCYGNPCSFDSFLLRYPKILDSEGHIAGHAVYLEQLREGMIGVQASHALPVHPTQLYEATGLVILFVVLHWMLKRSRWAPGVIMLTYAVAYALLRFIIEFFRGDPRGWIINGRISTSQGIALLVVAAAPLVYLELRKRNTPQGNMVNESSKG